MEKILKLLNDATYVVTYGRDLAEIELYINPNNGNTKVFLYPEKLTNDNRCGDDDFDEIKKITITSGLDRCGQKEQFQHLPHFLKIFFQCPCFY